MSSEEVTNNDGRFSALASRWYRQCVDNWRGCFLGNEALNDPIAQGHCISHYLKPFVEQLGHKNSVIPPDNFHIASNIGR